MADTKSPLPDISTIQPDRLIKYRVSEDRFSAEVLLPGLWYTDFDKKIGGKLTLWSFSKLFESVRWVGFMYGMQYYPELVHGKQHTLFVASNIFTFTRDSHYIQQVPHWGERFPLRFLLSTPHVGNSSYTFKADMLNHENGNKIASGLTTVVYVDAKTRKPAKLPAFFKQNVPGIADDGQKNGVTILCQPDIPLEAYTYQVKVLHSDCDLNQHANSCSYIRWCMDAGTLAACDGRFKHFTNNIELYPVEQISNLYLGEVLASEVVAVSTWEDPVTPTRLHFVVTNQGNTVFRATVKYFKDKPAAMPVNFSKSKI